MSFPQMPSGPYDPGPRPTADERDDRDDEDQSDRTGELDDFVARAVDRQIAEQRALRETLAELTEAVRALDTKKPGIDADDLTEQVRRIMRVNTDAVLAEMREMRESPPPPADRSTDTDLEPSITGELDALRAAVGSTSADIEGIAQALIDLNAGLREWADGVDRNIGALGADVESIRDLTAAMQELQSRTLEDVRALVEREPPALDGTDPRLEHEAETFRSDIEQRMKESVELSLYLADQIEGFDQVLAKIADLPERIEGVVSQALKRMLAARAKLDNDAQAWLADALNALDDNVARIEDAAGGLGKSAASLGKLSAGQTDVRSGLDALRADVRGRLDRMEADRRRTEEALAGVIDSLARGKDPRAAAALGKGARKGSKPPAKRPPSSRKPSRGGRRRAGDGSSAASGETASDDSSAE